MPEFPGPQANQIEIRWAVNLALNQTESWWDTTDENHIMSQSGQLRMQRISHGFACLDTGTKASLIDAGTFVKTSEDRQGLKIACSEEIAWRQGLIDRVQLQHIAQQLNNPYGESLSSLPATV
ncbi:MAG: hypothetical protein CMJ70_08170 [Planctomycetaceae bacterium]|nr:hypothetical protein [Planctomycetaceae bacterium]HAA70712.1 hypothetical protein [Planctomycetaceae bacterium]